MKIGDIVQMVTGLPGYVSNPHNNGIVIKIKQTWAGDGVRRNKVATVMSTTGEIMTWPLDSHYEIKVIHESR